MDKKIYDKVADTSIMLNGLIDKLKECQKEKEELLSWIEELKKSDKLEEKQKEVEKKMKSNLQKFEKVVSQIIKLNEEYKLDED